MASTSDKVQLIKFTNFPIATEVNKMKEDLDIVKRDMSDIKFALNSLLDALGMTENNKSTNEACKSKKTQSQTACGIEKQILTNRHVEGKQRENINYDFSKSHQAISEPVFIKEQPVASTNKMINTQRKTKALLDSYIDNLSIHGATKVFKGSVSERIFWALVMLGVLGYLFFSVNKLVASYLTYSVINNIEKVEMTKLKLPSVTICDFNGYSCNLATYNNINYRQSSQCKKYMGSVPFVSMLCQVNSSHLHNCPADLIEKSPDNPMCLTFNPKQTVIQTEDRSDRNFKIKLQPISGQIRLFFHQSGELTSPFIERRKNAVEAGKYNVIIKQTNVSRLPSPYPSNCIQNISKEDAPFLYTKNLCQERCVAENVKKKCGTLNKYWRRVLPSPATALDNITAMETSECVRYLISEPRLSCPCPKVCEETHYEARIEQYKDNTNTDIISLNIYFELREVTVITEVSTYDAIHFLADIGGLMGLLLGMSVLSVFEVLFCLVLFIIDWILSWKHKTALLLFANKSAS